VTRRRSRDALWVTAISDGHLSAFWEPGVPRTPLPYLRRSLRCMLGRHKPIGVWDWDPDGAAWWPAVWVHRCRYCGVRRPTPVPSTGVDL
jgi:hypothetical protein